MLSAPSGIRLGHDRNPEGVVVQDDPASSGADDIPGEQAAWPWADGQGAQRQPSLLDDHVEALAVAEQVATWRAFAAPLAADSGAVVQDPELVKLAAAILAVYADHQSRRGLYVRAAGRRAAAARDRGPAGCDRRPTGSPSQDGVS